MSSRSSEVRDLMKLNAQEVITRAGNHLEICENVEFLHYKFANTILREIEESNRNNALTRLILPVGPTGQYPILADFINKQKVSLKNCWLFFMDEYCIDSQGLPIEHPLSFKRIAESLLFKKIDPNIELKSEQVFFPDENNIDKLAEIIDDIGGIDTCYGGIGIHGHIAFNEPENDVLNKMPRVVRLNNFTITINAIRAQIGGNIENFPKYAFTLGMQQIINSKRIRLYCRNGTPYDWANTILRIALFGKPGDDYPVTHIRNHPDYLITTDWDTLQSPKFKI